MLAFLVLLSSLGALPFHRLVSRCPGVTGWKLRGLIQRPPRGHDTHPNLKVLPWAWPSARLGQRDSRPVPLKPQTLLISPHHTVCRIVSPLASVPQTQGTENSNRKPWFLHVSWQPVSKSIKTQGIHNIVVISFLSFLRFFLSSFFPSFLSPSFPSSLPPSFFPGVQGRFNYCEVLNLNFQCVRITVFVELKFYTHASFATD